MKTGSSETVSGTQMEREEMITISKGRKVAFKIFRNPYLQPKSCFYLFN
jgi:hypothetical protein